MKTKRRLILMIVPLLVLLGGLANFAGAAVITFDEVALGTTDPLIENVQFYAGDPASLFDTIVLDDLSLGNPYLYCGFEDETGEPVIYGAKASGLQFTSVSVALAATGSLPSGATFSMQAYSGGVAVGGLSSFTTSNNAYQTFSVSYVAGFDEVRIFDGVGDEFRIDNFTYTEKTNGVPEPASVLLLATGLAGLGIWRKRSAA